MLEVLSDTVIYFVLYAFIGWISEVIYAAYEEKRFVNRGVLAGPICPIYGFGAVLILGIDALIKPGTVPVYVSVALAVVVTTVLEYITGYILEKNFNIKAWITVMRNLISMDEFVLNFHFCGNIRVYAVNLHTSCDFSICKSHRSVSQTSDCSFDVGNDNR